MGILVPPGPSSSIVGGDPNAILPGTGTSGPGGVDAIIQFGSTYLNVRSWIDTFLITSIDGLGDADIRDTRDVNPGAHGETPFASWYGGRTVVLTGKIRAHTVEKLRDMQQGLRATFADLTAEQALIFRTGDINADIMLNCKKSQSLVMGEAQTHQNRFERDFQVTLRASNPRFLSYSEVTSQAIYGFSEGFVDLSQWSYDLGLGSLVTTNARLAGNSTAEKRIYRSGYLYPHADWRETTKFHTGASVAAGPAIAIGERISSSNFIYGEVLPSAAASTVRISRIDAGGAIAAFATSAAFTLAVNTDYWLRTSKVGNVVTASVYAADPAVGSPAAVGTISYTLTSTDITKFGTGVVGLPTIRMNLVPTDWYLDDFILDPIVDRVAYTINNKGNFYAQPIFRLFGPVNANTNGGLAATILNATTGQDLVINAKTGSTVAVASGRYIEIDIARRTMKEYTTAGQFVGNVPGQLDVASEWMELPAGQNIIELHTPGPGQPSLEMRHRHTWI